jgi:hypothetical protein
MILTHSCCINVDTIEWNNPLGGFYLILIFSIYNLPSTLHSMIFDKWQLRATISPYPFNDFTLRSIEIMQKNILHFQIFREKYNIFPIIQKFFAERFLHKLTLYSPWCCYTYNSPCSHINIYFTTCASAIQISMREYYKIIFILF